MRKILLVADSPYWIFNRHCLEIKKRLVQYDFEIIYRPNVKNKSFEYYDSFDLIYILDTRLSIPFNLKRKTVIGVRSEFAYPKTLSGIKDYYTRYIENRAKAFHVVNSNQMEHFDFAKECPLFLLPHGVDTDIFHDDPVIREKPIVGINGSTNSGGRKGFDIVANACDNVGLELKTAKQNKQGGHLSKEQMPDFYRSIDIYCNMSESEGLNNSIMEAGAMGKFVIATPVGATTEMIIPDETGFLCARDVGMLTKKIELFLQHKDKYENCGGRLKALINEKWSWNVCIKGFERFFQDNML